MCGSKQAKKKVKGETNLHFKREGVLRKCVKRRKRVMFISDLSYAESSSYLPAPPERAEQSRFGNQNTKDPGHGSC